MSKPINSAQLEIQESAAAPPTVTADGTVQLHLIRPCVGKGKGRHVYEADMLESNAHKFAGWKMFVDHDTSAQKRQREGLPRSVDHLGGIVVESHWDPNVPAEGRFGAGAVVGTVKAAPKIVELLKVDPGLVESSINARATAVRPVQREGAKAWLVEGIEPKGTVDWVSDGGAGGKVVQLLEAAADFLIEDEEISLFESMTDDDLAARLSESRPELIKSLVEAAKDAEDDGPGGDGGSDEDLEDAVAKLVKKGMPRNMAMKVAKRQLAASAKEAHQDDPDGGGDVAKLTPEEIQEALQSPEVAEQIGTLVTEAVEAKVTERLGAERTAIRAEAYADAERQIEVRDLRDVAYGMIEASHLPDAFAQKAKAKFSIVDGEVSDALDVFETVDGDGNVTASAEAVLREAVLAEIAEQRGLVASILPTRVRAQGPQGAGDGDGSGGDGAGEQKAGPGPLMRGFLKESGFDDPDKAFEDANALLAS